MKEKLYFQDVDSESCYTEDWFLEDIREGETEVEVFEVISDRPGGGIFWCKEHEFFGDDSSDTCGNDNCTEYEPRKKISGCCKHHSCWGYSSGDNATLTLAKKEDNK